MNKKMFFGGGLVGLIFLLSLAFFILPSTNKNIFLSPDETANAVMARVFSVGSGFSAPRHLPAWVHPRSFVSLSERIVPVSFLGMPFLLSIVYELAGDLGMSLFTPLLALSTTIPLWFFTRKFGRFGQVATLVGWLSFPVVILYANRGLFPNLPVVCFSIWAAWLVWRGKTGWSFFVSGLLTGLALIIRPTEFTWILPWILTAWWYNETKRSRSEHMIKGIFFLLPLVMMAAVGAWLGWRTYGSWFTIGYRLRDFEAPITSESTGNVQTSLLQSWPFGFHPRNVWFNFKSYLIVFLWPWLLVTLIAMAVAIKNKSGRGLILLSVWTVSVLTMIYGQSLYQDHIRANQISLANSFLRYLLPVSVVAAVSLGYLASELVRAKYRLRLIVALGMMFFLSAFGYWTAFVRDDEGIFQNRSELAKYDEVRNKTRTLFSGDRSTIILSERSDKIFFPSFMAVSPLPARERINFLLTTEKAALYLRTQTPEQLSGWEEDGIRLKLLFTAGNESLYSAGL